MPRFAEVAPRGAAARRKSAAAKRSTVWLSASEEGFVTATDALTAPVRGRVPEERRRGPYCSRE